MSMARVALVGLAIVMAGCSSGGTGNGPPFEVPGTPVETTRVDLPRSYRFEPAVIEVAAGSTVTWENHDDFPHNVTLLDGSDLSRDLPLGGSATIAFDDAGTVYYECSLHPQQMHGKIIVR